MQNDIIDDSVCRMTTRLGMDIRMEYWLALAEMAPTSSLPFMDSRSFDWSISLRLYVSGSIILL